jgi:hypothetical protein
VITGAEIRKRLRDYEARDSQEERRLLVEKWKEAHPAAVQEASPAFHPLILAARREPPAKDAGPRLPDEEWHNDFYFVVVRRWKKDPVFGTEGGMVQIGISSLDGTSRHDWRDFQAIKNQLAGGECEAFELYPAESRLLDPSNYYTLWCFPGVKRLKIGHDRREVLDQDQAYAPQRALPRYEVINVLRAAYNALRSYQYGNSSPELAEEVCRAISAVTGEC